MYFSMVVRTTLHKFDLTAYFNVYSFSATSCTTNLI